MRKKLLISLLLVLALSLVLCACGGKSETASYDDSVVTIEEMGGEVRTVTIGELRELEQHHLNGEYKRTTGTIDRFQMDGPYIKEILAHVGFDITEYEGLAITGHDGYYCLYPRDIIEATPDFMLSLKLDGEAEMDKEYAPAMVGCQGQFGPYWVKKVNNITLYKDIPQKDIKSVWVFSNLSKDIAPVQFEYYGSIDNFIDLEQIWARFDNVDTSAFFTMKSSDGFAKNEAMNLVLKRYYIKIDGADAPTNINPNIILGMNVQHIAWFSSNEDACIFPEELVKYMTLTKAGESEGVTLADIMTEAQVELYADEYYALRGMDGEYIVVPASDLEKAVLCIEADGKYSVKWTGGEYENIPNLLRVQLTDAPAEDSKTAADATAPAPEKTTAAAAEVTTSAVVEKTTVAAEKTTAIAVEPEKTTVASDKTVVTPVAPPSTAVIPEKTTAAAEKTTAPAPGTDTHVEIKTATVETTAVNPAVTVTAAPEPPKPAEPEVPDLQLPPAQAGEEIALRITGDGVLHEVELTMSQLKAFTEGYYEGIYSMRNNFPTYKFAVAKGLDLAYLLNFIGLKSEAALVTMSAADGFYASVALSQVMGERYCFPKFKDGSAEGAVAVPALIAWAYKSGSDDLSKAKENDELTFVIGQVSPADMNNASAVQGMTVIEVSCEDPGQWAQPQVAYETLADGKLSVSLVSDEMDFAKYYYTLDGSEPTQHSAQYNPSTSAFKPDMTKPIVMEAGQTLKILAAALGKENSEILTWKK